MQHDFWQKQTADAPLFPELLWSRPENRRHAGKLLIIGGNRYGFAAAADAFATSQKAGIGTARVLLPDSLQKTVGKVFAAGEYAPSNPSGSFSQKALAEFLALSQWSDGVLLAGDLGRNSETAIVLEKFAQKYSGPLCLTKDAADYFTSAPGHIPQRADTTTVLSFAQLQKLATNAKFIKAFTFDMGLLRLVRTLHEFTRQFPLQIVVKHLATIFVASDGEVSSTQLSNDMEIWRVKAASYAAVWQLQNTGNAFAALTCAIHDLASAPQAMSGTNGAAGRT